MAYCDTCAFYKAGHGGDGHCANPFNAEVKWIGGGEYSSSEQVLIPMRTDIGMVCDLHTNAFKTNHRRLADLVKLERTQDMKPWDPTKVVRKTSS